MDINVHSIDVLAVTCSRDGTMASIFGTATINGAGSFVYRIDLKDLGEPGTTDTYRIRLITGYDSRGIRVDTTTEAGPPGPPRCLSGTGNYTPGMDRRSALVLLAVFGSGVFLAGMELLVTAVALPSILADLADPTAGSAWVELR